MKNLIYTLILLASISGVAQVGIGTETPDASSMLDITSTETGILIPRMTTAQRNLISAPANGLMIFNTDADEFQYNSSSPLIPVWQALGAAPVSTPLIGQSVKYTNTDVVTDLNEASAVTAPLIGNLSWNDNTTMYVANALTNQITINETGRYKIIVNIPVITGGGADRMSPEMRITVNGTEVGSYSATGYIRTNNGHQESSLHLTEVLEITAGQIIGVNAMGNANTPAGAGNNVVIRGAGSASIYIEKLL